MTTELVAPTDENVAELVDVFHESFYDYPVMRYVLGTDHRTYDDKLRTLIGLFVMARVLRKEYLLGIRDGQRLTAAAIVSRPVDAPPPDEFLEYRAEVWSELGTQAESRYDAFAKACAPFQVEVPHLHLNMIGVRAKARGTGQGRTLLEYVHQMSASDDDSQGVTLTTEVEGNVPLYRYFGYRLLGEASVGPSLQTWGFYRPDSQGADA